MKKILSFVVFAAALLIGAGAHAASGCYHIYNGVNCGADYVMYGGACGTPAQVAAWDAYCGGATNAVEVYCLGTYASDPANQPHSCTCDTGYAYTTATYACTNCASGYVDLNGQCMDADSVIYDADKDTIVSTEWNSDEDFVRNWIAGNEKTRLDADGLHILDSMILTQDFADDYFSVLNESDEFTIKSGSPSGSKVMSIDEEGQIDLKTWGEIDTTDYGAFNMLSKAVPTDENSPVFGMVAYNEIDESYTLLSIGHDASGSFNESFGLDPLGRQRIGNWATITTGDYGPYIVTSNAVPNDETSPVFIFAAKENISDDYILLSVGDDASGTYDQEFAVDAVGQHFLGNWASVTTTDYGAYIVSSEATSGDNSPVFVFNAKNNIGYPDSTYVFLVGDDGDASFTPLFGVNGVGQVFASGDLGSSDPSYSFLNNHEVGMFYYENDDTVSFGLYGNTEFQIGHDRFEGETYQAKSGGARVQGAWTDGAWAHAFQVGNKYQLTNADVSLIDVFDGPIMGIGPTTFTGGGPGSLTDMFTVGTFSGAVVTNYAVEIDTIGATDTFKWSDDGGATWDATGVAITGSNQVLNNGVYVLFRHETGHAVGNRWDFDGIPITKKSYMNISGGWIMGVDASKAEFPNALSIVSQGDTGFNDSLLPGYEGLVAEGVADATNRGRGIMGIGKGSSARVGTGVVGWGLVNDTSDTVNSIGVGGYAWDTHAGGANIGVFGSAISGDKNYSFYGYTGDIWNGGREIYDPSITITYLTDADIPATRTIMRVAGNGGAVTNIGLADGEDDGQMVILQGTSDANTVTLTDNRNCQLSGGANMTLGNGDTIQLIWDEGDSDWYEVSRSNN